MDHKISQSGIVIGVIAWFFSIFIAISSMACLKYGHSCDGFDLFLFAIISVGMLAPAYVAALIFSAVFGSKE
jgi:hypothetical protein